MSEFILSGESSKNKIFLLNHSDLEDRFDAQFYWEDMDFSNCIKLSKIAKVSGGKRLPKGFDYSKENTNYRYLRIGNINWDSTLDYDNFKYISEELYTKLKHYEIHNSDLLLAIVGATIGKCSLINIPNEDKIILTENCAKIQITDTNVLPNYLLFLLQSNFVQKQIQLNYVQTTLPKLGLDRVLSLHLPTPPSIEKQQKLLDIYQSAFLQKKQKEQDANKLLDSIDDYLLKELGITLPEIDNSLDKRVFTVNLSDICGGKFNSDYYSLKFKNIFKAFENSNYDFVTIKDILLNIKTGTTPSQKLQPFTEDIEDIPFLRNSNIQNGEIHENFKYIKSDLENHLTFSHKNEIIICIAGTVGISALNTFEKLAINQNVSSIIVNTKKTNPHFLVYWLNTKIAVQLLKRLASIATISYVNNETLSRFQIPLPPLEKQNEIVAYIQNVKNKVKELQQEAINDLKNAKIEVEKIILGQ